MKWNKILLIAVCILLVVVLIGYGIYWAFFDIQRIKGERILAVSESPDGAYTVTAYLNDGGATTDYAVLCSVKKCSNGKERNIYWNYHCYKAEIEWLDATTVCINGVVLDVTKDSYDWRNS